ncbi:hemerythrin domain-containing protein [Streptomyces sp. S.PB5]|uniref:hemerythrin domain-containing protein n=1 Tax=Streptomyces sp. S.PB5 TaxID=3020844 RepID=UPI0025B21B7D|nr:hemerythrin domain-containing protein [Streptomyces sp. S.PB5]MDN3029662.1 hemerythrin domain-containing protein [Streptomyces sp. S.PB5]
MPHTSTDRADVRDMLVVHEAFRQNYSRLPELIRSVSPGDVERAAVVADHAQLIEEFLHLHHKGEDELLWPKLLERAGDRLGGTVALLESQHEEIAALLAESAQRLAIWREQPSAESGEPLADSLERLGGLLTEHLGIEEKDVLPLVPDHVTEKEWHELGDHAINALPKNRLPVVFGMLASLADPEVVKLMLSSAPLVPRLIMPVLGPKAYARHARKVYGSAA